VPLFGGSASYLPPDGGHVESPACDELIRLAMAVPQGRRLYVAAIAALTNVASALLKAPQIKDRIAVYWLGGNARDFADQNEFNLRQDRRAAQVVFDSGAPVVWFPCRGVSSHLSLSLWEAIHWMQGKNQLADALVQLMRQNCTTGMGQSRILWDMAPIAALCNPQCIRSVPVPAPLITEWCMHFAPERHSVDYVQMIMRDQVFADFFAAIGDFSPDVQPIQR
jgi:inosine-uridine nucleoside N-ribohydrolase